MARLAWLAVLPFVMAAALLGTGTATASVGADEISPMASCSGTFTSGGATVTVRCTADNDGTEFRARALCPSGAWHYGAWVDQGVGHVSVAKCANPMIGWGWDLR